MRPRGLQPNLVTYYALIGACDGRAMHLLQGMRRQGLQLDVIALCDPEGLAAP